MQSVAARPCSGARVSQPQASRAAARPIVATHIASSTSESLWGGPRRQHRLHAAAASGTVRRHAGIAVAAAGSAAAAGRPKRVVITGGSKGLGFALAAEFLQAGDCVAICGRNAERLDAAVAALGARFGADRIQGMQADCSSPDDMLAFANFVSFRLGGCDIWINNAGEVTAKRLLADVEPEEVVRVVGSNVLGSLLGSQQALRLMRAQPAGEDVQPRYHIFNCGFSRWGAKFTKSAVTHKATKRVLTQLVESLADELREAGITSVGVHNLSPGMLLTDLLLKDSTPAARRFFNALAEEPETVAAALAPQIRGVRGSGTSIDYLTPASAALRVVSGLPQILGGGRFFDAEGRRVARPGERYAGNGVRVQVPTTDQ